VSAFLDQFSEAMAFLKQYPLLELVFYLLLSILVAFIVRALLTGLITNMARKTSTMLDDQLVVTFQGPVVVAIVAFGFYQGLKICFPQLGSWQIPIRGFLSSIVIVAWMGATLRYVQFLIDHTATQAKYKVLQPRTQPLFRIVTKAVIFLAAAYFIIIAWDLNITGWLASAGVVGIAVGFAAKDSLANLISGIFIIADGPYQIGNYIVMEDGLRGRVTDIGIRSTRMLTRDDVEVIIPNAVIGNTRIVNQSGGPNEYFRMRVSVGVAYGSDIDQVRGLLEEAAEAEPLVLKEPAARVRLRSFGDSSLDFELLAWVENPERLGMAMDKLLTFIYKSFRDNGVEIPFPKRDVYLHKVEDKKIVEALLEAPSNDSAIAIAPADQKPQRGSTL